MKTMCVVALVLVGLDCVLIAVGKEPQVFFPEGMAWLWWFPAAAWFIAAFDVLFNKRIVP